MLQIGKTVMTLYATVSSCSFKFRVACRAFIHIQMQTSSERVLVVLLQLVQEMDKLLLRALLLEESHFGSVLGESSFKEARASKQENAVPVRSTMCN
eukprot:6460481-Amphidinium_carterae.1